MFVNPSSLPPGGAQPPPNIRGKMATPSTTIELSVRGVDLSDRDLMSKSDPLCIMYQKVGRATDSHWREVGKTELVENSLNPAWEKKFVVEYKFEERQQVKFDVYDWDSSASNSGLNEHDFLGRCETTLGQIVSSQGKQYASVLKGKNSLNQNMGGKIFVTAEELTTNKEVVNFGVSAKKLDNKDLFGKSDPFLTIYKESSNGQWTLVHKTEVVSNNLNPSWKPFAITMQALCNGDYERKLKIQVDDYDNDGSHDLIGSFVTTMSKLKTAPVEKTVFQLINDKKKAKKGSSYKDSGKIEINRCDIVLQPSFVDYIQGGTSINFSVAVDFTASNGDPRDPRSLHYLNPTTYMENQYTTAIRAVGDIIEDYDTDKQFPALGFGAKIPPLNQVSFEFYLNLSTQNNPYCAGVDGLLAAYQHSLQTVELWGPTNFSPIINHVSKFAQAYQADGKQYFVLLILTDGIITDLDATMSSIVSASNLPLSIIIIGVGNEDFSAMEALDSDGKLLRAEGRVAARDIVQFVELRKFLSRDESWNKEDLAKEVLAEIPKQLVGWMTKHGIKPT
jgi:hypothetical protein